MQLYTVYFIYKLFYMFRVVSPPIIRSTNICIYSQPLLLPVPKPTGSNNGWLEPDSVDTVIYAPDDGWRNRPKHVEQFTDNINSV